MRGQLQVNSMFDFSVRDQEEEEKKLEDRMKRLEIRETVKNAGHLRPELNSSGNSSTGPGTSTSFDAAFQPVSNRPLMSNDSFYSQPGGVPSLKPPPGLNPLNHTFTHLTPTRLSTNHSKQSSEISERSGAQAMSTSMVVGDSWD